MLRKNLVTLCLLVGMALALGAAPAQAACSGETCPLLDANMRMQIGNGLPLPASAIFLGQPTGPLNAANPARGLIRAIPGAVVSQGAVAPRSIMLGVNQLTAPQVPFTIPLFDANPFAFQLKTSIAQGFPTTPAVFAASGRVGPSTATWCIDADPPAVPAGTPVGGFNPGCLGPNTTALAGPTLIPGLLRYTRTANQFGGTARALPQPGATADIAINIAGIPALPCGPCTFGLQVIVPGNPQPIGATWGAKESQAPVGNTPGRFIGSITSAGLITNVIGPTPNSLPSFTSGNTTWGAPWTTGMITASHPTPVPPEIFMITGSDERTPSGEGTISLVSGSLSTRGSTGPNVNRGWLRLTVPEPSTALGLAASVGLLGLLRRHRQSHSR